MTARFVLLCDVCGAITDDHYPYPVARARQMARAVGFHYRKVATTPGDLACSEASYHRTWLDLCAECMYAVPGLNREPVRLAAWNSRWHKHGFEAMPMNSFGPTVKRRYAGVTVVYNDSDGPYRLYTALVRQLKPAGVTRPELERLRREMFAADAAFVDVAKGWANVITEETESTDEAQDD